ncbi:MAG TPA: hypothetical protein VJ385_16705 [Fibrobacteria bacterium]|nr:hypothetical protein [Fibrobacteria bacterium]
MTSETQHEVKSASAILAEDVICQSFIQSSSTLAYACLLIRQGKYDLAVHVLHSLEAKQASRFKDMVFYLQAQIGVETGEYAMVKKRLVPRVHQHPNDMVALSLLECCVYHEWIEWSKSRPPQDAEPGSRDMPAVPPPPLSNSTFGNAEAAAAAAYAAAYDGNAPLLSSSTAEPGRGSGEARPVNRFLASGGPDAAGNDTPLSGLLDAKSPRTGVKPAAAKPAVPAASRRDSGNQASAVRSAAAPAKASEPGPPRMVPSGYATGSQDGDMGIYQVLAADQNTQALAVWNAGRDKLKSACRNPELDSLVALLPQELPASVQDACTALECGTIHKICFSFQALTVTSFHAGAENLGLVTGNINQSLLTIVRAENTFRKQAASLAQAAGTASAPRPPEFASNE